jgi:predicted transport protein
LGDLNIVPVKQYIGFKLGKRIVTDFEVQKSKLRFRVNLKKGMLDDPKKLFRDVSNIGTFGVGDYEAIITPETDLDYIMLMVKQSYKVHS